MSRRAAPGATSASPSQTLTTRMSKSDQEARQASAFRPGKESAKPVRASLGATDQSAAVAQEHQPCELFPIARA